VKKSANAIFNLTGIYRFKIEPLLGHRGDEGRNSKSLAFETMMPGFLDSVSAEFSQGYVSLEECRQQEL